MRASGPHPNDFAGTYVSSGGRGGDRGGRDEGLTTPRGGGQEHAVALDEFHDGLLLRLVQLHVLRLRGPLQDALEHRLRAVVLHRHHRAGQRSGLDPRVIDGLLLLGQLHHVGGCVRDEARATRGRGRVPEHPTDATVSTHASRASHRGDHQSRGDRAHPPSRRVFSSVMTTRALRRRPCRLSSRRRSRREMRRFYFFREGADPAADVNSVLRKQRSQIRGMHDEAVCKKCSRKKKLTLVAFGA